VFDYFNVLLESWCSISIKKYSVWGITCGLISNIHTEGISRRNVRLSFDSKLFSASKGVNFHRGFVSVK